MSEKLQPRRMGKVKVAAAAMVGLLAIDAAADRLGIDINLPGIKTETAREVEEPTIKVTKIEPIDIGCFVKVESEVNLKGHKRHRVHTFLGSQTMFTDTTEATLKGDSMLCVDNESTRIDLVENNAADTKDLYVVIGRVFPHGRIVHDGTDKADYRPSLGTRLASPLTGGDGGDVLKGLQLIGQELIQRSACVDEAVEVAKDNVRKHYEKLAEEISGGAIDSVNIRYAQLPTTEPMPVGRANDRLKEMGFVISDDFDVDVAAPVCTVTTINGEPVIEEK